MTNSNRFGTLFFILFAVATLPVAIGDETLPERVSFNRDIRPILSDVCFHCHGPDQSKRKADLRFDSEAGALADLGEGRRSIVAGKPETSELIKRIESTDPDSQMPPPDLERQLTNHQKALLRRWIEQGAKWESHWSFVQPVRSKIPSVKMTTWPATPLDTFILSKLEHEGLHPSRSADKSILLRRVTLDLTGLPPTPAQVSEFLKDDSPDAYERVVDRLLASARYGERMAARWLNGARYADTSGYQSDGERTMWRWRDWVIEAFNANMPFDQFTIEQLAGDLLPHPNLEQLIATGFNRNHRGNAEGGIIPEEYAVEYVVDRVETTATVWLGMTAMCARCHNHKYDPLSQAEFYQLYAYFNNVPEKGRAIKYGNSPPYIVSPTRDQQEELLRLERRVAAAESKWLSLESEIAAAQAIWERNQVPDQPAADSVERGLSLYYPLDGNSTATVSTSSASARPSGYLGQLRTTVTPVLNSSGATGDPKFGPARFGQGLECLGNNYASAGDVANFGFFDRFSVSAWIMPQGDRGGTIISRMTDLPNGDGWGVVLEKGKLQVHLTKRWLDDACRIEVAETLKPNDWLHVTVTYDGSREAIGVRVYLDGKPQQTVTLLDELNQSFDNKGPLRIGGGNGPEGRFHGVIDDVRIFDRVVTPAEAAVLSESIRLAAAATIPVPSRAAAQSLALRLYFVQQVASESIRSAWREFNSTLEELARFRDELPTTMVMQEMSAPRATHILIRGEYDKPGEPVSAGVPASLSALPSDSPQNRLGLAKWLVDRNHPLTARVAVNRLWQMAFGAGFVKTVDDFGQQGEWPSHPELLDWLAVDFRDGHAVQLGNDKGDNIVDTRAWDTKRTLRQIFTSAAYRQSSQCTDELRDRDPENRLLARGPRFRLPAEMVRDQALFASGLLVERLGGPSVKPYQPDGLWKDLSGLDYDQDHGSSLYRRSLYTFWKRTLAPPSMITFDAAGRETCIVKETRTNTPLQALNLMNDVTYVEAARMLGERMLLESSTSPADRITFAFQCVLGRNPREQELKVLRSGYEHHLSHFQSNSTSADALTKQGEFPRDPSLNVSELAACTTVAGLILNLDEAVTRE